MLVAYWRLQNRDIFVCLNIDCLFLFYKLLLTWNSKLLWKEWYMNLQWGWCLLRYDVIKIGKNVDCLYLNCCCWHEFKSFSEKRHLWAPNHIVYCVLASSKNTLFFLLEPVTFCRASMFLFFRQFEPQVFLFLFLFIHVLINCNLYTWQLLHTWPVEKAGNFPFQKGKKEILKNFPKYKSIVYNKLLIDSKRLLWYIFLFLTEHNPSFTLFLICSYFFTQSELRFSYKECLY